MSDRSPVRTCLGCGKRDEKSVLFRVAVTEEGLQPEEYSGRGGYLHNSEDCWRAFLKRKSLYRAFRRDLPRKDREELLGKLRLNGVGNE
jgi:predicted RNA-binding protein YlxR (DUF448 family)